MEFKTLSEALNKQFKEMSNGELYVVDLSKDELWDGYQAAFPEGTNEIYQERRAYDCQTCRQFIRNIANVVAIVEGQIVTIWDVDVEGYYQTVVDTMANLVRSRPIKTIFLKNENQYGVGKSYQQLANGDVKTWNHFNVVIPDKFYKPGDVASLRGKMEASMQVFQRGLDELTDDATGTVLDLIAQNSLYRGSEFKEGIESFRALQLEYALCEDMVSRNIFAWTNVRTAGARIRNTAIGTLLQDLSEGKELEDSVKSFEAKVAPANYKRTSALATPGMKKQAAKEIEDLGIREAIPRRYADISDVSTNNVLFVDRSVATLMKDPLDELLSSPSTVSAKSLDKVEEISIEDFIKDVVPTATSIEALMKNSHVGNLMSIVAPTNEDAPNILKWNNNFSWSYNGDVTDSMKERVKAAGGKVDGYMRFSIQWNEGGDDNFDLDAHCVNPRGHIYYGNKSDGKGTLDIDIQTPSSQTKDGIAVENITWPTADSITPGVYKFVIVHCTRRQLKGGFRAQFEFNGEVHEFDYTPKGVSDVTVITVNVSSDKKLTIVNQLPSTTSTRTEWGVETESFRKISSLMLSPNHWDGNKEGNKHYFFTLEGCANPNETRGLYNEFLMNSLTPHRKSFDLIGSAMKCPVSDKQLSGLGFSETVRNELIVKVTGSFTRMLKIKF